MAHGVGHAGPRRPMRGMRGVRGPGSRDSRGSQPAQAISLRSALLLLLLLLLVPGESEEEPEDGLEVAVAHVFGADPLEHDAQGLHVGEGPLDVLDQSPQESSTRQHVTANDM